MFLLTSGRYVSTTQTFRNQQLIIPITLLLLFQKHIPFYCPCIWTSYIWQKTEDYTNKAIRMTKQQYHLLISSQSVYCPRKAECSALTSSR